VIEGLGMYKDNKEKYIGTWKNGQYHGWGYLMEQGADYINSQQW
jgi:hypothetical protein